MDNELFKTLNEELIELRKQNRLAEQRLDLQREELNRHSKASDKQFKTLDKHTKELDEQSKKHEKAFETSNRHQAGFEILFENMTKMGERLDAEIRKLRDQK